MNALLAIPLLLQPGPTPAGGGMISFEARLVDCETLGWRKDFQARLHFGGHRAGSSAWVADDATMAEMVAAFAGDEDARVVSAPKVAATAGDPAVIGTSTTRHFVVHAEPATGPAVDGDPMLPRPVVAPVDDGSQIRLAGLPGPEGMRLKVQVVDSRVASVHVIEAGEKDGASYKVQVPEVSRREVGGEWVLPDGHGLVLSLGVESSADHEGKPTVRERLLLISTRSIGTSPAVPATDPGLRLTLATPSAVSGVPAPVVATATDGPMPSAPASVPDTIPTPTPTASGVAFQPSGPITALAATPWGLLPIVPVEVVAGPTVGAGPAAPVAAVAMPLPALPSRNLPPAIDTDGRAVDPRTEKDRHAEQTDFAPYVDGKPVPTPQVTVPRPDTPSASTSGTDAAVRPTSAETQAGRDLPKADRSMIKVRLSLSLSRGFSVDVDLADAPESSGREAGASEAPVRR